MNPAIQIRSAIAQVFELRESARVTPGLASAIANVKRIQALRFRGTYADLLVSDVFSEPAHFFLSELYGTRDFADRDAQFARIAGSLSAAFPTSVVSTAVNIAGVHALTEQMDHDLATSWLQWTRQHSTCEAEGYIEAWRSVGRREDRMHQLRTVLALGQQLSELTRKPGIATLLKLMRRPAATAGLSSLQLFLESGFNIFATMARTKGKAAEFLLHIGKRESQWIDCMFDEGLARQTNDLNRLMQMN